MGLECACTTNANLKLDTAVQCASAQRERCNMGRVNFLCPGGFVVDIYLNHVETVDSLGPDLPVRSSWAAEELVYADSDAVDGVHYVHVPQGALNGFCNVQFALVNGEYELQATIDKNAMSDAWVSDGMPATWDVVNEWQEE